MLFWLSLGLSASFSHESLSRSATCQQIQLLRFFHLQVHMPETSNQKWDIEISFQQQHIKRIILINNILKSTFPGPKWPANEESDLYLNLKTCWPTATQDKSCKTYHKNGYLVLHFQSLVLTCNKTCNCALPKQQPDCDGGTTRKLAPLALV